MRHRSGKREVVALIVALNVPACGSSSYRPANSPRVSMIDDAGGIAYYRDGKQYDHLADAVQSNPRALAEARTARSIDVWTTGLLLGGAGAEVAGFVVIGAGRTDTVRGIGVVTVLVALGAEIAGFVVGSHELPHMTDAINIYNDGLPVQSPTPQLAPTNVPAPQSTVEH